MMFSNIEFILKIIFFTLSIIWAGKIMILRTDKQIVINPVLIIIASILAILPPSNTDVEFLGITIKSIRICLYSTYSLAILFGIYATNNKNGIF